MKWSKIDLEIGERIYEIITHGDFLFFFGCMINKEDDEFGVINIKSWQALKVNQFGNIPFVISRFANCIDIDHTHTLIFGGTDSAKSKPFLS